MDYKLVRSKRKSIALYVQNGEIIVKAPYFLPKLYIDRFVQNASDWIEKELQRQRWHEQWFFHLGEVYERKEKDVEAIWLKSMQEIVIPRAWSLAKRFGDEPKKIKISKAKKRWGSCSKEGNINLSYRLAQLPLELIDYVIIHELVHLHHFNHSQAFWQLVAKRCPEYKKLQRMLENYF